MRCRFLAHFRAHEGALKRATIRANTIYRYRFSLGASHSERTLTEYELGLELVRVEPRTQSSGGGKSLQDWSRLGRARIADRFSRRGLQ